MQEKLKKLLENSYSPYSHFPVAAVVVMKDGQEFYGVNVENASYGATICAERNVFTTAIAYGYKPKDFEKLYIMTKCDISTPCFMCRQFITEFFGEDKEIICMNENGEEKIYLVKDLCPYPFNEGDLKWEVDL